MVAGDKSQRWIRGRPGPPPNPITRLRTGCCRGTPGWGSGVLQPGGNHESRGWPLPLGSRSKGGEEIPISAWPMLFSGRMALLTCSPWPEIACPPWAMPLIIRRVSQINGWCWMDTRRLPYAQQTSPPAGGSIAAPWARVPSGSERLSDLAPWGVHGIISACITQGRTTRS
jgi:hypothetical protein